MFAVLIRALKDRWLSILIYIIAMVGLIWLYVAIYPSIRDSFANMKDLLKAYPESLMKAFNVDINNYVTFEGYISSEMFSLFWPLIVIFVMVGFAGGAIAGEVEKGTIELLLTQPISRLKLFFGKFLAGLTTLVLFTGLTVYSLPLILKAYNIDYDIVSFNKMAILGFLFGLAVFAISMLLTSIFSDKGKVFFISGGLIVAMYAINILASLKENLSDLKYWSFFHYFDANNALIYHKIDSHAYWIFLGVTLVCTLLGAFWFSKKDITV